jgi:transcriptional regulator of acetoin/glycerol metabolism
LKALDASAGDEVKLPSSLPSWNTSVPPEDAVAEGVAKRRGARAPSKEELLACLAREGNNISRVADSLGLHWNVVYRLIREYGIKRDETAP